MENWRKFRKLEQVTGKNNTKEKKGQKKHRKVCKFPAHGKCVIAVVSEMYWTPKGRRNMTEISCFT